MMIKNLKEKFTFIDFLRDNNRHRHSIALSNHIQLSMLTQADKHTNKKLYFFLYNHKTYTKQKQNKTKIDQLFY